MARSFQSGYLVRLEAYLGDPQTLSGQTALSDLRSNPVGLRPFDLPDDLLLRQADVTHLKESDLREAEAALADEHEDVHDLRSEVIGSNFDHGVDLVWIDGRRWQCSAR